jgi:alpha-amylase/alpha-mannosidase (GH57 family)
MATDEGVLGRSLSSFFSRDGSGRLNADSASKLYTVYDYENGATRMNMIFRDHTVSDLIGFVYSGMPAAEAAAHLIRNIKEAAQPVLNKGLDVMFPIILDGENAWEYYPQSGREFLRRFYAALEITPGIEAVTVSEAITRHTNHAPLRTLTPGSWIHANFNVWIGAPEDNRAWDYLSYARDFYAQAAPKVSEAQRKLAFEEILIAEGSDWNWWYGPEHHSANDRDFDELYRKHLSNVYRHWAQQRPSIWLSRLSELLHGPPSFLRQRISIPESLATWSATSNGLARPCTRPTSAPARCMAEAFCSIPYTLASMRIMFMADWTFPAQYLKVRSTWW